MSRLAGIIVWLRLTFGFCRHQFTHDWKEYGVPPKDRNRYCKVCGRVEHFDGMAADMNSSGECEMWSVIKKAEHGPA